MAAQLEQKTDLDLMTKVAIVEDSPTLRQYLAELIGGTPGHRCVCACASAEEALVKIPAAQPNVVLMDIHLPGESGIACTAQLRQKQTANASTLSNSKRYGNVRRKNCMLVDTIRTIWLLVPTFTGAFPNVTQFVLLGDALD